MPYFRRANSALIVLLLVAAGAAPALAGASLDIRPSECPNLIDRYSRELVPVALVSDVDFVVSRVGIDIASLELTRADGVGGMVRPFFFKRGPLLRDVAAPRVGGMCSTFGVDGIRDLQMYFGQAKIVNTLELGGLPRNHSLDLCLSGQTVGGTPFEVCDNVIVTDSRLFAVEPDDDVVGELP